MGHMHSGAGLHGAGLHGSGLHGQLVWGVYGAELMGIASWVWPIMALAYHDGADSYQLAHPALPHKSMYVVVL